jgi:CRISPR system Cascade subunit CasE
VSGLLLSRVRLLRGAANSPDFWSEVGRQRDVHRLVWSFLPAPEGAARDFLFRQDGEGDRLSFYVLSRRPLEAPRSIWSVEESRFTPALWKDQVLEFALRANAVRRSLEVPATSEGALRRAERRTARVQRPSSDAKHDIVMLQKRRLPRQGAGATFDEATVVQEEGSKWLAGKAQGAGFELVDGSVRADGYRQHRVARGKGRDMTFSTIELSGWLKVVEPQLMIEKLWSGSQPGLGSARGFGCGLVLVRRPGALLRATPGDDEDEE